MNVLMYIICNKYFNNVVTYLKNRTPIMYSKFQNHINQYSNSLIPKLNKNNI